MAQSKKKKRKEGHSLDYVLLTVVLFLVGFGLLMIYSTSSYEASVDYGDAAYYLKKQLFSTILGFIVLAFISRVPYQVWKRFDMVALVGSIVLILLVLTPLGVTRNGATRWLDLKIGLTLQPAEVAKLGIIIYLASIITKLGRSLRTFKGFMIFIIPPTFVAGLIYVITDNLSSAIIIMGIAVAMLFVAIPDYKYFIIAAVAVLALAGAVVVFASGNDVTAFRLVRIKAWLDPESYSTDRAFQTLQALYAIGSGGLFGRGLGNSIQKLGSVPEAQNDMIFSIICEETGLFGAILVILLFGGLIWRLMVAAVRAEDLLGELIGAGIMGHIALQVILNIAVVTNTIPNTGITLPFISYGGTSVLFLMGEMGLALSVTRYSRAA